MEKLWNYIFTLLLLAACSNKSQPLDDITLFQEKITLCGWLTICNDEISLESIQDGEAEIVSEFDRLELMALKHGFTETHILSARKIASRNE